MAEASTTNGGRRGGAIRRLGLFTVLCIGVNNIVGTGIYQKPATLAHALAGASWFGFAADALLLVVVALCFSTMAARHAETGGPYVYAKQALGRWPAFIVAWTAWISMWAAAAAVTSTLPGQLAVFFPGARAPATAIAIGLSTLVLLGSVNCIGIKPAAGTSNLLTVAKLVPLALFVAVGAWHLLATPAGAGSAGAAPLERVTLVPTLLDGTLTRAHTGAFLRALGSAMFAGFYALQGFEAVPVPAAELAKPRRDVPLAVTGALVVTAALYCLIQIVAYGVAPVLALAGEAGADGVQHLVGPHFGPTREALLAGCGLAHASPADQLAAVVLATERPLSEAASHVMGSFGSALMAAGACVSFLGFAAVTIFCAPRFLVALADDGMLPALFGRRHPRFQTPVFAVVATCVSAAVGGLVVGAGGAAAQQFDRLTALANVAVLVQYSATCYAVLRLPVAAGAGAARRIVTRRLLPIGGLGVCLFFAWLISNEPDCVTEVAGFVGWTVAGIALAWFTLKFAPRPPPAPVAEGKTRIYSSPVAQPYVWSPLEKESLARTQAGGPNPWADAAAVAHAQALARAIREQWRSGACASAADSKDERALIAWIVAQARHVRVGSPLRGLALASLEELEHLSVAALRELRDRLDDLSRDLRDES